MKAGFLTSPLVKTLLLLGFFVILPVVIIALIYNGFISRRNQMRNAFSSIDVQLKKRWNLIPNLVETVKSYAAHEKELFESVTAARSGAQSKPAESGARFAEEEKLTASVGKMLAVAEAYPELKSGEHFLSLQRNLTEIESQISAARRSYNAAVQEWNNGVESFPSSILAGIWNFKRAEWFEARTEERNNTDVRF